ncbi:MAG: isocitrate lyase/PEP mutase family protein [Planctomycetes bacterium]|nr:isocitrate lyase/PEP mutase family protein [Planctomycetota bacterium]
MNTRRQLRKLLSGPRIIRSLGAHDVFTARLIEAAGLETVFIGGFGTSASLLGLPDVGFLTLTEMADAVRRMAQRVSIPVVADGDTGHGDLHNVVRTVREFERAGAAGILLEDQVTPKRCGHFQGKQVIPREEMVLKLRAALDARKDADFVIVARTDARAVEGFEAAVERANRYGAAGADICFIEAPENREELEKIPRAVGYPLLVNMLTGGVTPILPVEELERLGYKIAVCPIESLLVAGAAIQRLIQALLTRGRVEDLDNLMSFAEVKHLLGLEDVLALRKRLESGTR